MVKQVEIDGIAFNVEASDEYSEGSGGVVPSSLNPAEMADGMANSAVTAVAKLVGKMRGALRDEHVESGTLEAEFSLSVCKDSSLWFLTAGVEGSLKVKVTCEVGQG